MRTVLATVAVVGLLAFHVQAGSPLTDQEMDTVTAGALTAQGMTLEQWQAAYDEAQAQMNDTIALYRSLGIELTPEQIAAMQQDVDAIPNTKKEVQDYRKVYGK